VDPAAFGGEGHSDGWFANGEKNRRQRRITEKIQFVSKDQGRGGKPLNGLRRPASPKERRPKEEGRGRINNDPRSTTNSAHERAKNAAMAI